MKHIIYYFSGTGNSMRTAVRIAKKSEVPKSFPSDVTLKTRLLKTQT